MPTKFELTINQTTAKALGVAIALSILLRPDEVACGERGMRQIEGGL
jgi:hypothetical protein